MKNIYSLVLAPLCLLFFLSIWNAVSISQDNQLSDAPSSDAQVERGAYLVNILACNDCHTPFKMGPQGPEPDMERMLSGHPESLKLPVPPKLDGEGWGWVGSASNTAFAGPWGITYAANLTPDGTGLKEWTQERFMNAIKNGWHMGVEQSRMIQPPMPWPAYRLATEEDLAAIFAFLQTVPAVQNIPPAYQPPSIQ